MKLISIQVNTVDVTQKSLEMEVFKYALCSLILSLVGTTLSQSTDKSCNENSTRIASSKNCKDYYDCLKGIYVKHSCGFWQEFDTIRNECRWSPLAKCQVNSTKSLVQTLSKENPDKHYCNYTSEYCHHGVPVLGTCELYCYCFQNGKYSNPLPCKPGYYYDVSMFTCTDDPSVCQMIPSDPKPGSICLNPRDKTEVSGDCKKYYECSLEKTWTVQECAWGLYFNSENMQCQTNWLHAYCFQ